MMSLDDRTKGNMYRNTTHQLVKKKWKPFREVSGINTGITVTGDIHSTNNYFIHVRGTSDTQPILGTLDIKHKYTHQYSIHAYL